MPWSLKANIDFSDFMQFKYCGSDQIFANLKSPNFFTLTMVFLNSEYLIRESHSVHL